MLRRLGVFLLAALASCGGGRLAFAQLAPGQGMYREDSAHADGHWGVFGLVVRKDVAASICGTDGDYCPLQVNAQGALRVELTNTTLDVNTEFSPTTPSDSYTPSGGPEVTALLMMEDTIGFGTFRPVPGSETNGVLVDLTRLPNEGQQTMANSISVAIASNQSPLSAAQSGTWNITNVSGTVSLPTGAATLAEQQTQTASLSVIDDWDESDRAKVNPIVGQAGVQGGSGAVSVNTQRVVLATDVALPTGTNTIGATDRVAVAAANNTGSCITVDTSSDAILASNASRRGFTLENNGSVTFFLKLGATATTSNGAIPPGAGFSITDGAIYTGAVDGITSSSSTSVCVWEW